MTIHKILPKVVYQATDICVDQLEIFEKEIKSLNSSTLVTPHFRVKSSHQVLESVHRIPPFKTLTYSINEHLEKFLLEYGYSHEVATNTKVDMMWFNIGEKGNFLFPHTHPGSFISGVFYVKTTDENVIHFYDPNKSPFLDPQTLNEYSSSIFTMRCVEGSLLLFHSDLHHGTPYQEADGEKIILSFNSNLSRLR